MTKNHQNKTYVAWCNLRGRCRNDNPYYARKGIRVCERWNTYENFLEDMGEKPAYPPNLTLERVDGAGPYSPENCRWASTGEQARNRSNTRFVKHNGVLMCVTDWAKWYKLPYTTLTNRINKGWDVAKALETPPKTHKRRAA